MYSNGQHGKPMVTNNIQVLKNKTFPSRILKRNWVSPVK